LCHVLPAAVQGYLFGVLSAFLSAIAAVYTEWVMKRNLDSLYWQNMQLYSFGVAFNALGLTLGDVQQGEGPITAPAQLMLK
jgi:UDP-sugar transporter A1/2/3